MCFQIGRIVGLSLLFLTAWSHSWLAAEQEPQPAETGRSTSKCRIGLIDSRAVAIAYYRSPQFRAGMEKMVAAQREAKNKGDQATVESLEKKGAELNEKIHRQGFGTASIRELLQEKSEELETIAEQAKVIFVVSKWDIAFQHKSADASVEFVDLTDELVKTYQPDEATVRVIEEIKRKEPVEERSVENKK